MTLPLGNDTRELAALTGMVTSVASGLGRQLVLMARGGNPGVRTLVDLGDSAIHSWR